MAVLFVCLRYVFIVAIQLQPVSPYRNQHFPKIFFYLCSFHLKSPKCPPNNCSNSKLKTTVNRNGIHFDYSVICSQAYYSSVVCFCFMLCVISLTSFVYGVYVTCYTYDMRYHMLAKQRQTVDKYQLLAKPHSVQANLCESSSWGWMLKGRFCRLQPPLLPHCHFSPLGEHWFPLDSFEKCKPPNKQFLQTFNAFNFIHHHSLCVRFYRVNMFCPVPSIHRLHCLFRESEHRTARNKCYCFDQVGSTTRHNRGRK